MNSQPNKTYSEEGIKLLINWCSSPYIYPMLVVHIYNCCIQIDQSLLLTNNSFEGCSFNIVVETSFFNCVLLYALTQRLGLKFPFAIISLKQKEKFFWSFKFHFRRTEIRKCLIITIWTKLWQKICLLFLDIQADKLVYLPCFPSLGYCLKIVAALDPLPNSRWSLMPVS